MKSILPRSLAAIAALAALGGCATGPVYNQIQSNIKPQANTYARLYFYRENSIFGAAFQPNIKANGIVVGESKPGGFFYVDVKPGHYHITVTTEVEEVLNLNVRQGEVDYIKTTIGMGVLAPHINPILMSAEDGAADIQELHLIPATVATIDD